MLHLQALQSSSNILLYVQCSAVMWKYCWHITERLGIVYWTNNAIQFLEMVHWSLCAWSELNFSEMWYLNWLHHSGGKRTAHKSFLDIAASLPQTHFLPAFLCLSSKLHNPCQSCLDCRLKVIHKKRERERLRKGGGKGVDGEGYNLLWMGLGFHTLMIITPR